MIADISRRQRPSTKAPGILFLTITLFLAALVSAACTTALTNALSGNREHGLTCEQLPAAAAVDQAVAEHADVAQQILAVNPGNTFFDVDRETCPGKADIVVSFATVKDRQQIEAILGDGSFFGVPVRLMNR